MSDHGLSALKGQIAWGHRYHGISKWEAKNTCFSQVINKSCVCHDYWFRGIYLSTSPTLVLGLSHQGMGQFCLNSKNEKGVCCVFMICCCCCCCFARGAYWKWHQTQGNCGCCTAQGPLISGLLSNTGMNSWSKALNSLFMLKINLWNVILPPNRINLCVDLLQISWL